MSRHRWSTLGVAVATLLQLACAATACAQIQAMPPSTATTDAPPGVYGGLGNAPLAQQPSDEIRMPGYPQPHDEWTWQMLPTGLIWKSYLADAKDSRMGSEVVNDKYKGWLWDATLGGRVGLLRYGTQNAAWPEGFEVDIEGAAFPRLNDDREVIGTDFRAGCPITYRQGQWEAKLAYQHECSHLGDLYIEANPGVERINYVRDEFVFGVGYRPIPAVRIYCEVGWAFHFDGGAEPWDIQFGAEYSPVEYSGFSGTPFFAVNTRLRQELNFGGAFTLETGWQWRGEIGQLLRTGLYYFNGSSNQFQFYRTFEDQVGVGLWYDY
jgi:hypothetical protein